MSEANGNMQSIETESSTSARVEVQSKGQRGVKRKRDHSSEARENMEPIDKDSGWRKWKSIGESKLANHMKRHGR